MMPQENDPKFLTIEEIFHSDEKYLIPLYQRPYAWRAEEIEQLIDDIKEAQKKNTGNYYLGTLVVFNRSVNEYETIDGQQRLTTLLLLLHVLGGNSVSKIRKSTIVFKNRQKSEKTLSTFLENGSLEELRNLGSELDVPIYSAIEIIQKKLHLLEKSDQFCKNDFKVYLLTKVKICRVSVPKGTDLNHYFEIMNNRGEQLEMHEIVKARLLDIFKKSPECVEKFGMIWDNCANMGRYIQMNFDPDTRNKLFGDDLNSLTLDEFNICKNLDINNDVNNTENEKSNVDDSDSHDLCSFLTNMNFDFSKENEKKTIKEFDDTFTPIIDFPNFLLLVLRVFSENKNWEKSKDDLNDKELSTLFDKTIFKDENKTTENIVEFFKTLLRMRFLLDNYVIHRSNEDDWDWKLEKLKQGNDSLYPVNTCSSEMENNKIIKLLSMYEVTYPGRVRKEWLGGVLRFLSSSLQSGNGTVQINDYIEYLENSAQKLLKNYYLSSDKTNMTLYGIFKSGTGTTKNLNWGYLDQGTNTPNFAFNYLDYLLWRDCSKFKFSFKYHNSVEHFYPRNPKDGTKPLKNIDCFGNLYLTSRSNNSRLSNDSPMAKLDFYKTKPPTYPKQKIMYSIVKNIGKWDKKEIKEHSLLMKIILKHGKVDPKILNLIDC